MTAIEMFQIGGCVRDRLMGVAKPKDIDRVVIAPSFEAMTEAVEARCSKLFRDDKTGIPVGAEFFTLRGLDPVEGAVDFVWARIDGPTADGRRPLWVKPGTLLDDQSRRDFRCNSIAMMDDGTLVDPFNGAQDIATRTLRFVGNPADRLAEDALRALRGFRFQITLGFSLDSVARSAIRELVFEQFDAVSTERIREELLRCFAKDTPRTLRSLMMEFPNLLDLAIERGIWFKPTVEKA